MLKLTLEDMACINFRELAQGQEKMTRAIDTLPDFTEFYESRGADHLAEWYVKASKAARELYHAWQVIRHNGGVLDTIQIMSDTSPAQLRALTES
jgi:hypothetical protein